MEERLIIREVNKAYEVPAKCLRDKAGFIILTMLGRDETPIQSKAAWLRQGIAASVRMIPKLGRIRKAGKVILIGNYMSLFSVFLNKVHIIHPDGLYWWGFQIRGASMQKMLRHIFGVLKSDNLKFIIFSNYERRLYAEKMGLSEDRFISIPYGDWQNMPAGKTAKGDYYFAGGYSNRDYAGLLRAWKKIDMPLVIIGSRNNRDLYEYSCHPDDPNVDVFLDVPPNVFQEKLEESRGCIFPFISNTGASGQTVALKCMKSGKLMISADIDSMREYVKDGETGFLLKDMEHGLPEVISRVESDPGLAERMIKAQTAFFRDTYSYETIMERLAGLFI